MSTLQTETPKPAKADISADGSENELPGNRQNSIRQNARAVSWFSWLRVYAERVNGRLVTRMLLFDGTLRQHRLEILAHDLCHGEFVLQDLSVTTKRVELFVWLLAFRFLGREFLLGGEFDRFLCALP